MSFGQTIYLSKFYEVGEAVPGVLFVNVTEFRSDDATTPQSRPRARSSSPPAKFRLRLPTPLMRAA